MNKRSRRSLVLAASCLLALALSAVGVAIGAPTGNAPNSAEPTAAPTVAVKAVSPDTVAAFRVFREAPPTAMPGDVSAMVGSPERFGRNPALARQIQTATGTGWVIPGDGHLCIAVPDPVDGWGTSCAPTAVAIERGLGISLTDSTGKSKETLLVPDGRRATRSPGSAVIPLAASAARGAIKPNRYGVVTALTNAPSSLRVAR